MSSADQTQSLPQPAVSSQPDSVANTSSGTSKPAQSVQLAISKTKPYKKSPTRPSVEQSTIADLRLSRDVMARQLSALIATNTQITNLLVTKTHRIRKTNSIASEIFRNIHQYSQVEEFLNSDELLTITGIQDILSPLLSTWAQAEEEHDIYFYKANAF